MEVFRNFGHSAPWQINRIPSWLVTGFFQNMETSRQINKQDFPANLTEQIKFVLRYAILAPSTHNSQPWQVKIVGDMCQIFYDPQLLLPEADRQGRDLYISLGCMLENLIIAAKYFGIYDRHQYFFSDNHVANIYFSQQIPDEALEPKVEAITKRINVRGFFDQQKIPVNFFDSFNEQNELADLKLHFIKDKQQIRHLAGLTAQGIRQAYSSKSFRTEMSQWLNSNFSQRREGLHGYSLKIPAWISIFFPWLIRNFNLGKRLGWLNQISISSAPAMCVFTSQADDKLNWLETGRLAERIWLTAESLGLHASVFVAAVEIGDVYKQVQKLLNTPDRPQFIFCLGYMKKTQPYSPRHEVASKILTD